MSSEFADITNRYILVRNALMLKPSSIAEQSGLTKGYISKVENYKSTISLRLISFLCLTHKVNLNWLFTGEGEMFISNTIEFNPKDSSISLLETERKVLLQIIQNLSILSKVSNQDTKPIQPEKQQSGLDIDEQDNTSTN